MSYEPWIKRKEHTPSLNALSQQSQLPNSNLVSQQWGSVLPEHEESSGEDPSNESIELRPHPVVRCATDAPAAQPECFDTILDEMKQALGPMYKKLASDKMSEDEESEGNVESEPKIFNLMEAATTYNFIVAITIINKEEVGFIEAALDTVILAKKFEYCGYFDRTLYYGVYSNFKTEFAQKLVHHVLRKKNFECDTQCFEVSSTKTRRYRRNEIRKRKSKLF